LAGAVRIGVSQLGQQGLRVSRDPLVQRPSTGSVRKSYFGVQSCNSLLRPGSCFALVSSSELHWARVSRVPTGRVSPGVRHPSRGQAVYTVSKVRCDDTMVRHRESESRSLGADDVAVLFRSGGSRYTPAHAKGRRVASRFGDARNQGGHHCRRIEMSDTSARGVHSGRSAVCTTVVSGLGGSICVSPERVT